VAIAGERDELEFFWWRCEVEVRKIDWLLLIILLYLTYRFTKKEEELNEDKIPNPSLLQFQTLIQLETVSNLTRGVSASVV